MAEDAIVTDSPLSTPLPAAPVAAVASDFRRIVDYIEAVRRDHVQTAALEAQRLAPYLTALSRQLFADLLEKDAQAESGSGVRFFGPPVMPEVLKPKNLSRLFTAVARDSRNTILSEMIVAPKSLLEGDALKGVQHKKFFSNEAYRDHHYGLGFIQVPTGEGRGSVSVSVFSLAPEILDKIPEHVVQPLLNALQKIVTAGNHDMQHHYTNKLLNSNIAGTAESTSLNPQRGLKMWNTRYFGSGFSDKFPDSYESWLMLNHSRVVERLDTEQHQYLYNAVEDYFNTLKNVSAALDPVAVDYLSMMACFAMHRYLRLDHPLMLYAVERTQEIDRRPENTIEEGRRYADWADNGNKDMAGIVESYADLFGAGAGLPEYQRCRLLQIAELESWSALLLAPVVENTASLLRTAHKQVSSANLDMVEAAASDSRFVAEDGEHSFVSSNGRKVTYVARNGMLDARDRPALVVEQPSGHRTEEWYNNGELVRKRETGASCVNEEWRHKGCLHREGAPAQISVYADGTRHENWWRKGEYYTPSEDEVAVYRAAERAKEKPSLSQRIRAAIFSS